MEFFLQPGVQHCTGGVGPDTVDLVDAVAKWREGGAKPSTQNIVATKLDSTTKAPVLARPLCKYSSFPKYKDSGVATRPTGSHSLTPHLSSQHQASISHFDRAKRLYLAQRGQKLHRLNLGQSTRTQPREQITLELAQRTLRMAGAPLILLLPAPLHGNHAEGRRRGRSP